MRNNCINHQFINAHWHCKKCDKDYCFECVEKKHFKFSKNETFVHICPDCKRNVDWVGIAHIFHSPKKTIIDALKYPFSPNSLLVILAIAIVSMFFSDMLLFNELLFLIIWCILLSYSTNITDTITKGNIKAPSFIAIPPPVVMQHVFFVFKQASVYLVVCTLFLVLKSVFASGLLYTIAPVLAIPMPFIMMKIITSNTIKKMLDLSAFPAVIKKSAMLYMVSTILFIPVVTMFDLLLSFNPVVISLTLSFLMLFNYRLMGQIILECNSELRYSIDYENFKDLYTLESMHGFKT